MFNNLSSNTGASIKATNTECQLKNVYKCINDVEERVNDNCACTQCLQEQIDCINSNPQISKDSGTFICVNTDEFCSTNSIVAPGVQNDFAVAGEISANSATISGNSIVGGDLTVCGNLDANINCLSVTNEDAQCSTICSATIASADIQNITNDCISTNDLDAGVATIDNISSNCIGVDVIDAQTANADCVCSLSVSTTCLNSASSTLDCACICSGDIEILKNSKSIGTDCIEVPFIPTADFYRYQIPREFSGEVKLWNCDMSININTTDCHRNALIIYSAHDADVLKGFYRNNDDERLYIEFCSCCPLYYEYRTPQKCVYNFEDNLLICACTEGGATYAPHCTLYCACQCSHMVVFNANGFCDGLSVCGTLKGTYLEFECAYFPGGLILDKLCVNGPSYLDGCVYVGLTCEDAALFNCGCTELDHLHVHCDAILGDNLTYCSYYCLSVEWQKNQIYYTYDDQTEVYTCVGCLEFDQWQPNTYYWNDVHEISTVCVCAQSSITGPVTHCGSYTNICGDVILCCGNIANYDCANGSCVIIDGGAFSASNVGGCSYTIGNSSTLMTDGTNTVRGTATATNYYSGNKQALVSSNGIGITDGDTQKTVQVLPDYIAIMDADSRTVITADGIQTPGQVISGTLTVCGDIYQCGSAYCTHAEDLYSKCDCMHLRECASAGLSAGCYSGIEVLKYDGTNNTAITTDNTGIWCVGINDMQPIATRSNHVDMVDKAPVLWCAACKCLYTQTAICDCSNVVYWDSTNSCFYTGSFNLADGCMVKWCADCKCFYTDANCHEISLMGLGPIVLGCCCVTDPITGCTTEYCTIDAPSMVTAYTITSGEPVGPDCCVKIINITKECYDALPVKDACAYYMICDQWSGGLSLDNFCQGPGICLTRNGGDLIISADESGVMSVLCNGCCTCVRVTDGCYFIDTCGLPTYCEGSGIKITDNGGCSYTLSTKTTFTTQACYNACPKLADYLYITTDCCNFYYNGTKLNSDGVPVGSIQAYMGNVAPTNWAIADGSAYDATECAELYAILGCDCLPDLRETTLVGAGCNTTVSITCHDTYSVGTFKDDQLAGHTHNVGNTLSVGVGTLGLNNSLGIKNTLGICDTGHCHTSTGEPTNIMNLENAFPGCPIVCVHCSTADPTHTSCNTTGITLNGSVALCGSISVCGAPTISGAVTVCSSSVNTVTHGKQYGINWIIKVK